jgi:hypothetical protein
MRTRRGTVEHPFGTMKMRMGELFPMKTLPKVATEMTLCVLTYNLTRVLNIVGVPASKRSKDRCGLLSADRGSLEMARCCVTVSLDWIRC